MKQFFLLSLILCSNFYNIHAATLTVDDDTGIDNGVSPFATVAAAITAASSGDIIDITGGADATHTEDAITIDKNLTIQGQGQATTTLQAAATQAAADDEVFIVNAGLVVIFQNLTIQNGNAKTTGTSTSPSGAGLYITCDASTNISFANVTINNNNSEAGPGAGVVIAGSDGTVIFTDCIISNNGSNTTVNFGGGIHNVGATTLTLTRCSIFGNRAGTAGAGISNAMSGSVVKFINCTIFNNITGTGGAQALGGGLFLAAATSYNLINCTITNNSLITATTRGGGGIFHQESGSLDLTNTIVANNSGASDPAFGDNILTNTSVAMTQTTSLVESCHNFGTGTCATFSYSSDANIATSASTCGLQSYFDVTGSDAENNGTAPSGDIPTNDICGTAVVSTKEIGSFETATVLPVELTYFKGEATITGNRLTWQTATEKNNEGFEVEHSIDAKNWERLDFVRGNGTTVEVQNYTFTDEQPFDGTNYYRLKQIDFDGQFEYSKTVVISTEKSNTATINIYPNPVQDNLTVENGEGMITVFNTLGQKVRQFENQLDVLQLNVSDLNKGQYILHIQKTNGEIIARRFVK